MTKPSAQLLIVVHAWNDAQKLSRILTSIAANRSARDVPVLVVDNSSSASLGATVATAQRANTFHIDRRILRRVMRQLANGPLAAMAEGEAFGDLIRLGRGAFTIHDGKNAAMAMVRLFFPAITHVLHVDDDLVFPRTFVLPDGPFPSLTAIAVSGSPDLCRLEWLELYLGCLAKRADVSDGPRPPGLVAALLKEEPLPLLFDVIGRYTDLPVPADCKVPKRARRIKTAREFSCASFISHVHNYKDSVFPPWYEEDWFWINEVTSGPAGFIPQALIQEASRKEVLTRLEFEERGKTLTCIANRAIRAPLLAKYGLLALGLSGAQKVARAALEWRRATVLREIRRAQALSQTHTERGMRKQIEDITEHLADLRRFLESQDDAEYVAQIEAVREINRTWKRGLVLLGRMPAQDRPSTRLLVPA